MKKFAIILCLILPFLTGLSQQVNLEKHEIDNGFVFVLENELVRQSVVIQNDRLHNDSICSLQSWAMEYQHEPVVLITDADFEVMLTWNRWYRKAPGTINNADNPAYLTKTDFVFTRHVAGESTEGEQTLDLYFKGKETSIELRVSYQLRPGEFFSRRKIVLKDPEKYGHFVEKIAVRKGQMVFVPLSLKTDKQTVNISIEDVVDYEKQFAAIDSHSPLAVLKTGDFGQPVAVKNSLGGMFAGLEYPAATNLLKENKQGFFNLNCFEYIGQLMGDIPVESDWMVTAVTPEPYVKKWFFDYVDRIRVAPAEPYTLYNSWYDLRSADYPDVPKDAVMNEKNVDRIWEKVRTNMIEKNEIQLDAFVLDDGWDVYESDWVLRSKQFPNGLKPLSNTMAQSGTDLGIWFGPAGGYSFAMKRIGWMDEHGYEVAGNKEVYGSASMCIAGTKYSKLFEKRTTDFVKKDGVGYFKWDGIQFACSAPDHGHPVGIHSRRAIMESVIAKCKAVREIDPEVYLNITSGTWLSPWWVAYANQVWMDAADYAFADVPSISRRDNAITYRDYALYDDFHTRDFWFPISNLMTHGIIKGRLENISREGEPFDKFVNNAVLYFARGVSMWELYISPDELTDNEWQALSQSIKWAKDRWKVLSSTHMIGNNPALGNPYGYVHFEGSKGIIALRNPKVDRDRITIKLDPEFGLDPQAANLVIEQVYPKRYILPELYSAGGNLSIDINGFETIVLEVYQLDETQPPLLAGAYFEQKTEGNQLTYQVIKAGQKVKFLNPEKIETLQREGVSINVGELKPDYQLDVVDPGIQSSKQLQDDRITFELDASKALVSKVAMAGLLLKTEEGEEFPQVRFTKDGKELETEEQKSGKNWKWITLIAGDEEQQIYQIELETGNWKGKVELWGEIMETERGYVLEVTTNERLNQQAMPPLPYPSHEFRYYRKFEEDAIK